MSQEREFNDINNDILTLLKELKEHSAFQTHKDMLPGYVASIITHVEEYDQKELMKEIVFYQYRQHGAFKQKLYDAFYGASSENLGKLSIAYPLEGEAFRKYGKESVELLKIKMEEE